MTLEGEVFGAAFDVHGTWYARLQGGGGVLIPVQTEAAIKAVSRDNQPYSFTGRLVCNHRGHPREFTVSGVIASGTTGGAR